MQVEGVNDGSPGLVILMVDGNRGQPPSDGAILENVDAHLWSEVLAQEMGRSCTTDPSSDYSCNTSRTFHRINALNRCGYIVICCILTKHIQLVN